MEDAHGAWMNVIDRDMDNESFYKRGVFADFELEISIRKEYTSVSVSKVTKCDKDSDH